MRIFAITLLCTAAFVAMTTVVPFGVSMFGKECVTDHASTRLAPGVYNYDPYSGRLVRK
jgi:hypothetical protein